MKEIGIAVSQFFEVRHLYSDKIQDVAGHSDNWRLNLRQNRQWSLIAISANHGDLCLVHLLPQNLVRAYSIF